MFNFSILLFNKFDFRFLLQLVLLYTVLQNNDLCFFALSMQFLIVNFLTINVEEIYH